MLRSNGCEAAEHKQKYVNIRSWHTIINKCKIVNNPIIKNVKKGSPYTTCSEPSVTIETGNTFEKKFYQLIPR